MDTVTGKIGYIVYKSQDGHYSVLNIKKKGGGHINVTGNDLPTNMKATYTFVGSNKDHPKYGLTFAATSYEIAVPDKKEEIAGFLSSGIFKGIGPALAERIYERFGEESLKVIEETPEQLITIRGMSAMKAKELNEALKNTHYIQKMSDTLSKYGITADQCARLAKEYNTEALAKIEDNPYRLIKNLHISFEEADEIALKMGVKADAETRTKAAFQHIFGKVYSEGDTGIELQRFGTMVQRLLKNSITVDQINVAIAREMRQKAIKSAKLKNDGIVRQYLFTSSIYEIEERLAGNIYAQSIRETKYISGVDSLIKDAELKAGILLDHLQSKAIKSSLSRPFTVINGGPGTGKSTIINFAASIYEQQTKQEVILLATTGRAARRLEECTGRSAHTIHSYLKLYGAADENIENEDKTTISNALVIVDEFSMADTYISNSLFESLGEGVSLVLVGDIDQLPSVGPGAVLRDIIDSQVAEVVTLLKMFRSKNNNDIEELTHRIKEGKTEIKDGKGIRFHYNNDIEQCRDIMTELYLDKARKYGVENVMLLIPYRKYVSGVEDMNRCIQERINPYHPSKKELNIGQTIYREGDLVMHVKTNTEQASNGDIGFVTSVNGTGRSGQVTVRINGNFVNYTGEEFDNLTLAYATTVHKSQGSETDAVIVFINHNHRRMLYRNIPYVGFSRAKNELDVIYDEGLETAIQTYYSNKRLTLLPHFLKIKLGEFVCA